MKRPDRFQCRARDGDARVDDERRAADGRTVRARASPPPRRARPRGRQEEGQGWRRWGCVVVVVPGARRQVALAARILRQRRGQAMGRRRPRHPRRRARATRGRKGARVLAVAHDRRRGARVHSRHHGGDAQTRRVRLLARQSRGPERLRLTPRTMAIAKPRGGDRGQARQGHHRPPLTHRRRRPAPSADQPKEKGGQGLRSNRRRGPAPRRACSVRERDTDAHGGVQAVPSRDAGAGYQRQTPRLTHARGGQVSPGEADVQRRRV